MGNLSSRVRSLSISERRRRRTTTQSSSSPSPSTEQELSSIDNTTPVTLNATRTTPLLSFRSSRRTSSTRTNRSNGTSNSNATSNTVTSTNSNSNSNSNATGGGGPQGINQNGSVNTPTLSNSSSSSSLQSNRNSVVNNTSRSSSFGDDLIHSLTGQELRVRRRNHETSERNTRHSHNHSSNSNPHDQTSSSSPSSPSDQSREQDLSEGTLRMFYASRRESSQPFALVVMFFQNRPEQGEGNSSRIRHPDRIWFLDLQQSEVNNTYESLLALQERLGFVNRGVSQDAVKGLQTIRYTNGLFEDERCPICLVDYSDDETLRKLPCGHCFHVLCVDNWLVNHWNSCPLCRLPIEEASTTA